MSFFTSGLEFLENSGFLYIVAIILVYALVDSFLGIAFTIKKDNQTQELIPKPIRSVIALFSAILVVTVSTFFKFLVNLLAWYISLAIIFFFAILVWGVVSGNKGIEKLFKEAENNTTVQRAILGILILTFFMMVSRVFAGQLFSYSNSVTNITDPTQLTLLVLRSPKIFGILAIAGVMLVGIYAVSGIVTNSGNKGNNQ